ncbi:hypothetical protein CEXT_338231 [Caerostris extrusa]|uniref:Uncharacterized protein n=1 Tax=Caerostris extrusa TaxID=172846 RepID=A0AAV4VCD3_CAEEX|nr:hypothetical protein CEXT_338231 [Caerostris extrusa]
MDPELRFTRHIEHTANKALRKLSILRKLCGTTWGSKPKTVKDAFCNIENHYRAVTSSNNNKTEQECGLPPLENRRNLATIKFANRIRSNKWIISLPENLMNGRVQPDSKDPQLYSLIKISEVG